MKTRPVGRSADLIFKEYRGMRDSSRLCSEAVQDGAETLRMGSIRLGIGGQTGHQRELPARDGGGLAQPHRRRRATRAYIRCATARTPGSR
jgi:hypothetical protein